MTLSNFTSNKLEVSVSETLNVTSVYTIVTYDILLEGRLHEFLTDKARPCAYIKVIDPDAEQNGATFKIKVKRLKVRLNKGGLLVRVSGQKIEALGSDVVIDALKKAAAKPPRYAIEFRRVLGDGSLVGILKGKIVKDLSNPNVKPAVAVWVEYLTPHFIGWDAGCKRARVGVAFDGDSYYEIVSGKVVKLDLPSAATKAIEQKARIALNKVMKDLD